MPAAFSMTILGNPGDCRTEAEIYVPPDSGELIALVYETDAGWFVERFDDEATKPDVLEAAVSAAKQALVQYVNRKGTGVPAGLTGPGLSLWLMERADGTAMGRPIR